MTASATKVIRFSLDMGKDQRQHLKMFSASNNIQSVAIVRAMLLLVELNKDFADDIVEEIFKDKEKKPEDPTRLTIDLDAEQHRFLKLFSIQNGFTASVLVRKLMQILREDEDFANAILETIFSNE
jgi:hypothetical protein